MEGIIFYILYRMVFSFVVYHSCSKVNDDLLEQLERRFQMANAKKGLSGLLLFGNGLFFQYIEGAEKDVSELLSKIKTDPRHNKIKVLLEGTVEERRFPNWSMAFKRLESNTVRNVLSTLDYDSLDKINGIKGRDKVWRLISIFANINLCDRIDYGFLKSL